MKHGILAVSVAVAASGAHALQPGAAPPGAPGTTEAAVFERPAPTLNLGDTAPRLTVERWLKGDGTALVKGRVQVIVFWASWCEPCRRAAAGLTAIQRAYEDAGVGVAAINVFESEADDADAMVRRLGVNLGFAVALDELPPGKTGRDGVMATAWLAAAGRYALPTAFVIGRDGTVAWIGGAADPQRLLDVVAPVVMGTFDPAEQARREQEAAALEARVDRLVAALEEANRRSRWDEVLALCDQLEAMERPDLAPRIGELRFRVLLLAKAEFDAAYALGNRLVAAHANKPMLLNEIAWAIVAPAQRVKVKDLDLAMRAAARAADLTGGEDPRILDTVARVHFEQGDIVQATAVQTRAVKLSSTLDRAELQAALAEYTKAAAARTPGK